MAHSQLGTQTKTNMYIAKQMYVFLFNLILLQASCRVKYDTQEETCTITSAFLFYSSFKYMNSKQKKCIMQKQMNGILFDLIFVLSHVQR